VIGGNQNIGSHDGFITLMEKFDVGALTDLIQDGPPNQGWPTTEIELLNALILLKKVVTFIYNYKLILHFASSLIPFIPSSIKGTVIQPLRASVD